MGTVSPIKVTATKYNIIFGTKTNTRHDANYAKHENTIIVFLPMALETGGTIMQATMNPMK